MSARSGTYYKDFIHQFRDSMMDHDVSLVYEGEISQQIVNVFSKIAEAKLEGKEHVVTKRRVYHVMVECLQNICKHADENTTSDSQLGKGILLVGNNESQYMVQTGNIIENKYVNALEATLERVNSMSPEEIKENYKKALLNSRISDRGGAGLGFIDMVKKTGNPIEYLIKKIDDEFSFLVIVSKVDRILDK